MQLTPLMHVSIAPRLLLLPACRRRRWRRSDAATCKEIADLIRVGSKSGMRVGPAAATQLLELLRSGNPDLKVAGEEKEEAQGKKKQKR